MTRTSSIQSNALTLGKGTLLSRILGFVRDAAIAALIGSGGTADALLLAFRIPNTARQLLAEGAFAYVLVPGYRERKELGQECAWQYVRSLSIALFLLLSLVALCGYVFSTPLVFLLAPGFTQTPGLQALAATFMGLCLLSLPLVAGAAVTSSALMAEGRFHPPAYSSALFNAVIIAAAGMAYLLYGAGHIHAPYILCWGVIAAGVTQWAYQSAFLHRMGFSPMGPVSLTAPETIRSLRALPGSLFGVGGHQANLLAATFLASFLAEGSVSSLYFAERLIGFPLGIIGASVGLAALSDLAAIAPGDKTAPDYAAKKAVFASRLVKAGRTTLFFAVPAAVGTACLAEPLTAVIFGRGEFDAAAITRTSDALLAYMVGLPALAFIRPLLAGIGATNDTKTPLRAAIAGFGTTFAAGAALLMANAPWGPALAVSAGAYVNAALLVRVLAKRGFSPLPGMVWLVKTLAANAIMAACVAGSAAFFTANLAKAGMVPLGVAAYFLASYCMKIEEAALIGRIMENAWKSIRRKLLRKQ